MQSWVAGAHSRPTYSRVVRPAPCRKGEQTHAERYGQNNQNSSCAMPQELHKASRRLSEDASQTVQQLALVQCELAKSKAQLQQERC